MCQLLHEVAAIEANAALAQDCGWFAVPWAEQDTIFSAMNVCHVILGCTAGSIAIICN